VATAEAAVVATAVVATAEEEDNCQYYNTLLTCSLDVLIRVEKCIVSISCLSFHSL
jgi:hypothetical protein